MQNTLGPVQLSNFYHNLFVESQIQHFLELLNGSRNLSDKFVVDVGGGVGYFASAIKDQFGAPVRVIDMDPVSVEKCKSLGLNAVVGDAVNFAPTGDEAIVCFNLILHHLVGTSEKKTRELQTRAIDIWRSTDRKIFINEYTYESYFKNLSGWLIYQITSSRILSFVGKSVSAVIPAFRANTFGVGVRFRSHNEWKVIFEQQKFSVVGVRFGKEERVALPLRLLLIKSIRRDSYLLESAY